MQVLEIMHPLQFDVTFFLMHDEIFQWPLSTVCCVQAEPLDSGDSSSLYGVRLPLDMPPGIAYLEMEQGPFVGRSCPVVVMPHERFMATAEVLQLLRGDALAACSQLLGVDLPLVRMLLGVPAHEIHNFSARETPGDKDA